MHQAVASRLDTRGDTWLKSNNTNLTSKLVSTYFYCLHAAAELPHDLS
eukprot:COSAG06_NODE_1587_length_9009_cov_13.074972_5_plen_48_part_00